MRLLRCSGDGKYHLTELFSSDEAIPPYAILSHTWGADSDEVTYDDLINGTGTDKSGYEKIQFCAEHATQDGLEYFWIDTCCINQADHVELSHAITSMFHWYRNAARCYVYLSDVSGPPSLKDKDTCAPLWESKFLKSRWFSRGWTLQELLAPSSVEFFSQDGTRLGHKGSLEEQIHKATGIPKLALQGVPLSQFSVNERLSWKEGRQTKLEEDKAYSLLGLFGVNMPPIYGEGIGSAFQRLLDEARKIEKCLHDARLTDPRDDKKRIENTKGGLLEDSYHWILENSDFQRWMDNSQNRLLWIKGDPGKGKTMLLCGIINELSKSVAKTSLLSYFFCQATDSRINNATAVLRGLIYLLIYQQPSLVIHVQKKYNHAGNALFEDANAWVALSKIFTDIVQDPSLKSIYLVIDALDECVSGLPELLDFIVHTSSASARVKWVMSSRNWHDIEERFERAGDKVRLSLELNADSVSAAVRSYIKYKVSRLARNKKYSDETKKKVLDYLYTNANDTFLWAALVCQNLDKMSRFNVVTKLKAFPPGLNSLYEQMIQRINNLDDAGLCKCVLAIVSIVYRPITLQELTSLVEELDGMADDLDSVREVVSFCGSLLTIRDGIIYFVHQSAKDFLLKEAIHEIFPLGSETVHYTIFSRSLLALSNMLRRDIYELGALGYSIEQVQQPVPDPLAPSCYSCIYWIDHLHDWSSSDLAHDENTFWNGSTMDGFFREKYLYWLEALSLCKSMSKGVVSMAKLEALINEKAAGSSLIGIVRDARRFILYHKSAIEGSPLQVYTSALLFSPVNSLIRTLFEKEKPREIAIRPGMQDKWSSCLSTLEGHSGMVSSVAFSHDSARLASASGDRTVKIWDTSSSDCLLTLKGHSSSVTSVAFSYDSTRLASAEDGKIAKIWDVSSGECLLTLEGHSSGVTSVAFSHDSTRLASASEDSTIKIWDTSSGKCLSTFEGHSDRVMSVAFSHDSALLASASGDWTVKVWDANSGQCLLTLEGHIDWVRSVAFSHDSTRLASAEDHKIVKIWDASSRECLLTLEGHSSGVMSVAFSHDSTRLVSASKDSTIKVWDTSSGECLVTLKGHSDWVRSVAFSHDSTWLASASDDSMVKVWDASSDEYLSTLKVHSDIVTSVVFSHDSTRLASASRDSTVKVWDTSSGECLVTLEGHSNGVTSVAFSHDSTRLASTSSDSMVKVWDSSSGECLLTLMSHSDWVRSVAFSHDSARLASASDDKTVKIWGTSSGECLSTLEGHNDWVLSVAFSHDSALLASASSDGMIKVWDTSSGDCLSTLEGHSDWIRSVAFSHDSTQLASASDDSTVKVWDASSGKCLSTLEVGNFFFNISFDITDSYLRTGTGVIDISVLTKPERVLTSPGPKNHHYRGVGLSKDCVWITYNSKKSVWLPSDYRPSCSAVSGGILGIGTGNGKVWICKIS